MATRPANESNTITAHGYSIFDAQATYKIQHFKFGLSSENLLNTKWNEAQFATESKLAGENNPVDELHYTPGSPLSVKLILTYLF